MTSEFALRTWQIFRDRALSGATARRWKRLADLVDTLHKTYDNVGICWDFGHAIIWSIPNQVPCLNYLGSRIKVTHVHDNMGLEDEHRAPFLGNVKWDKIMPALAHCGYEGNFSFEVKRLAADVPEHIKDAYWTHREERAGEYLLSMAK